ncbi:MAG TPA: ATP-binding cassette domain-containing protein [Opitutaceae bacterium]
MNLEFSDLQLALNDFEIAFTGAFTQRVTVLFGASGAGKTSMLELIAGLRRPQHGRLQLGETVLIDVAAGVFVAPQYRKIGYVPQDGALFPHLSVEGNLRYGLRHRAEAGDELGFDHVVAVLEISDLLNRPIRSISGGEKQRVALGRALLAAPKLLLLDEPLASLDFPLKERVLPYLARVRDELRMPMVYVTHAPEEAITLGDEALLIERGRITRRGTPKDLFVPTDQPRYVLKKETP